MTTRPVRAAALVFDEVVRRSGLSQAEIIRRLVFQLERPTLSRQTLSKWRTGKTSVPLAAIVVVMGEGRLDSQTIAGLMITRCRTDPECQDLYELAIALWGSRE